MVIQSCILIIGILLRSVGTFAAMPAALPRFGPLKQNFEQKILRGAGGNERSCYSLFSSSLNLKPQVKAKELRRGLAEWVKTSKYTKGSLKTLLKIELELPADQVTYLKYQHVTDESAFALIRIFSGETSEGLAIPLVFERKYPNLKIERAARNYELGLLTKSEAMGDTTAPMLREALKYLVQDSTNYRAKTRVWATARLAQARLYRHFGFSDTGARTPDGLIILSAMLKDLVRINIQQVKEPLPLLTADEFEKVREQSRLYSEPVREAYKQFLSNEEILAHAPDKVTRQWDLQVAMAPAERQPRSWLFQESADQLALQRQQIESNADFVRHARRIAAGLIVEDRLSMGLSSSEAIRRIAYYHLEYFGSHRFNEFYYVVWGSMQSSVGMGAMRINREIPTMHVHFDTFRTREYNQDLERIAAAADRDATLREPW